MATHKDKTAKSSENKENIFNHESLKEGEVNKDFSTKGQEENTVATLLPQEMNKLVQDVVQIVLNSSTDNNLGKISKGGEGKNKVRGAEGKWSSPTPNTEQSGIREESPKRNTSEDKRASTNDDSKEAELLSKGMRKLFLATGIAGVGALGATVFALRAAAKVIQSTAHEAIQGLGNGFQKGKKLVGKANYRELKGLKAPFTAGANVIRAIVRNPLTRFAGGAVGAVVGTAGGVIKGAFKGIWEAFGGGSTETVSEKGKAEGAEKEIKGGSRRVNADKQNKAPKDGTESGKDADQPELEGPGPGEAPKPLMNGQGDADADTKGQPEEGEAPRAAA